MWKYIVKRILLSVLILLCVTFIIYTLLRCLPSSFVESMAMTLSQGQGSKSYDEWIAQLNAQYGLDIGIVPGYIRWCIRGNGRYCFRSGAGDRHPSGNHRCHQAVFQDGLYHYCQCVGGYIAADLLFCYAAETDLLFGPGLV